MAGSIPTVTVDTHYILGWRAVKDKEPNLNESEIKYYRVFCSLLELFQKKKIDLAFSASRLEADKQRDQDLERAGKDLKAIKEELRSLGVRTLPSVIRFDTPGFFDEDEFDDEGLSERIQIAVFGKNLEEIPLERRSKDWHNKVMDCDHLAAHVKAKREYFLTEDKDLLKKRIELEQQFNIKVMRGEDFLKIFNNS